jgi:hypothetical protein
METYKRANNKWTVNEILRLQREYELLELSVQEIAERHERSVYAILYKLEAEGFIKDGWSDARGIENVYNDNDVSTGNTNTNSNSNIV